MRGPLYCRMGLSGSSGSSFEERPRMKRIAIFSLAALVLLAPPAAFCSPGVEVDERAKAAIAKLRELKVPGVEVTSLTVEADKVLMEGRVRDVANLTPLLKMIEQDIGSARSQELSYTINGNDPFRGFKILVTPYAGGAHPPVEGSAAGK